MMMLTPPQPIGHIDDLSRDQQKARLLKQVCHIIDHTTRVLKEPDSAHPPLTLDMELSYRDRTRNFLPVTSVKAITRAYRDNKISKGIATLLEGEADIAACRQMTLSKLILMLNKEVQPLYAQDTKVTVMAVAEILSRTCFYSLTAYPDELDNLSVMLYERLLLLPGCFTTNNT